MKLGSRTAACRERADCRDCYAQNSQCGEVLSYLTKSEGFVRTTQSSIRFASQASFPAHNVDIFVLGSPWFGFEQNHADRGWKLPSPARQATPPHSKPPSKPITSHNARPLRHCPGRRSSKSQQARFCEAGNASVVLPPAVKRRRRDPERQGTRCAAVASVSAPGRRHRGISLFYFSPSPL